MALTKEDSIISRIAMEEGRDRPSWYGTAASYLRHFQHDRHGATTNLLPADRRIVAACRRLYRISSREEKAVMTGMDIGLSPRECSRVFNRLCYKLAKMSGLTSAVILPESESEEKE